MLNPSTEADSCGQPAARCKPRSSPGLCACAVQGSTACTSASVPLNQKSQTALRLHISKAQELNRVVGITPVWQQTSCLVSYLNKSPACTAEQSELCLTYSAVGPTQSRQATLNCWYCHTTSCICYSPGGAPFTKLVPVALKTRSQACLIVSDLKVWTFEFDEYSQGLAGLQDTCIPTFGCPTLYFHASDASRIRIILQISSAICAW